MQGLFSCREFTTFGPNSLDPASRVPPLFRTPEAGAAGLRRLIRRDCVRSSGIYGMLDANQDLIYVGKAKCLRARLMSYFRPKSRDPKAGRILRQTRTIVWEESPNEFAALLRELELIRRWQPRFNVHGRPGRRRPVYVCLGRRPAPYLFLARTPPAGILGCYGPVPSGWRVREAVRRVSDWYRLRDCPRVQQMVFADQPELFPVDRAAGCLRYEIGTCLGPCLGACTRRGYLDQVGEAQAFLTGADLRFISSLKEQMAQASAALAFERAAALRDQLENVTWLHERLERLRRARQQQSFIYPMHGGDGRELWYLIRHGCVVAALPTPADTRSQAAARAKIAKVYQAKRPAGGPLPVEELDSVYLVAAWFRRHPEERLRRIDPSSCLLASAAALWATPLD